MRDRVSLLSVSSQTLSALAAMEPRISAAPDLIVAVTLNVFGSRRCKDPSPQVGTHRLPNAVTAPPQGFCNPVMASPGLLSLVAIFWKPSLVGISRKEAAPPPPPRPA